MKTSTKLAVATVAGAVLALSAPLGAAAHVTVDPTSTGAGSYSVLTFAIPHGCDGSATTAITITIPELIASVTPTVSPGWDVDMARQGDRVATVTYTAHTPLPHELRDTFELSLRLPDGTTGDTLLFPVLQSCVEGSADWASTDAGSSYPAPFIVLSEPSGGHGHDHGHDHGSGSDATGDDSDDTEGTGHGDHGAQQGAAAPGTVDVLARGFGVGALIVGAVGVVIAIAAVRRKPSPAAASTTSRKESTE